jgi:hypothetical protein
LFEKKLDDRDEVYPPSLGESGGYAQRNPPYKKIVLNQTLKYLSNDECQRVETRKKFRETGTMSPEN